MSLIPNNPYGAAGFSLPQLYSLVFNVLKDLNNLLQQNPQFGAGFSSGFNMGPGMDMFSPGNNIFTGSLGNYGCNALGNEPYGGMQGSSYGPNHTPIYEGAGDPASQGGMATACGGTPYPAGVTPTGGTPSPTASTPAPTNGTPSPSGGSGGSNPSYANNMLDTLRKMNTPESLIEAYKQQYILLGLLPSDGSTSAPGGTTPPCGGAPTSTGGGPSTTGGTPTTGGSPTPSGGGGVIPVSGGGPTSPELSGAGKVDWSRAPDNLKKLQPYIQKAAAATGTPEAIIAGTIWQESGGRVNVNATDGGSDQGLMQIDNTTYDQEIAGQNGLAHGTTPTDPANNIMAGATYLAMMKKKFGSWDLALRGYNSGENGVDVHDPNARPAGTGDPTYIISIRQHVKNLESGSPLANR